MTQALIESMKVRDGVAYFDLESRIPNSNALVVEKLYDGVSEKRGWFRLIPNAVDDFNQIRDILLQASRYGSSLIIQDSPVRVFSPEVVMYQHIVHAQGPSFETFAGIRDRFLQVQLAIHGTELKYVKNEPQHVLCLTPETHDIFAQISPILTSAFSVRFPNALKTGPDLDKWKLPVKVGYF